MRYSNNKGHQQTCRCRRCHQRSVLTYYGRNVCERHWHKHSSKTDNFNLKREFGIQEAKQVGTP